MLTNKKVITKRLIYKSVDMTIDEEIEGVFTFDIGKSLYTNDVLEAVSFLIRNPKFDTEKIWDLELTETMVHYIIPSNTIYLLSGGDKFWSIDTLNWVNNYEIYEKKFQLKLYNIFEESVTLRDLKDKLIKNFNLDVFYEFSLFRKLYKETF